MRLRFLVLTVAAGLAASSAAAVHGFGSYDFGLFRDGQLDDHSEQLFGIVAPVGIGTLNDLTAEWTGGVFDKYGTHFYVSIQHNITGHGVILDITGWR